MADDNTAEDAIKVVKLRNIFYQAGARKLIILLIVCIIVILAQACTLVYVVTHPPQPKYFATSTDGRIMPLIPLDQPNLSDSALLQWASTAAVAAYTYDFVNYRQALQAVSEYFTPEGWDSFMTALNSNNNLNAVIDKKLIVSAVATGAPVVVQRALIDGRYTWKVQMPLLVTYQSASQYSQQQLTITMLIVRMSTLSTVRGIGIAQFIAAEGGYTTTS